MTMSQSTGIIKQRKNATIITLSLDLDVQFTTGQKVNFNGIKCKYRSNDKNWKIRCHHKWCKGPKKDPGKQ